MRNWGRGLILAVLLVVPCAADDPPADLQDVQQYLREAIKTFDFEFAVKLGEQEPLNWVKSRGRGFPAYTRGRFDTTLAHGGGTSFCFQMNGGDCIYEYEPLR
ncbi:MAG: hypothetical protein JXL80_02040, partial [Planctomycetes bacterium]|nr:hypothetical protein [Planctomycetota bacterium]